MAPLLMPESFGVDSLAGERPNGAGRSCGELALRFAAPETASCTVASVPAVARALREVHIAGISSCVVCVPFPWQPSAFDAAEIARLAPGLAVTFTHELPAGSALVAIGEALVTATHLRDALIGRQLSGELLFPIGSVGRTRIPRETAEALLRARGRAIIAATGKSGDGIVSRNLNRPISQSITCLLLKLGPVRPFHATFGTIALSVAMAAALLFLPGFTGQLWGALLFQSASIVDGVDGEIARATFRATPLGATFDSMVDAATNLSFFACLMINLYLQGHVGTAIVGAVALAVLATGMTLLGMRAASRHGPVTFNAVKERLATRHSRLITWLTWLTMRDFYALAAACFIALGFAVPGVIAFAVVVAGWFVVVVWTLLRRRVPLSVVRDLDR